MPSLCAIEGPMKGRIFDLDGETIFIGRSSKNDIQIKDHTISRKQIKIFKIGSKYFVEDLKSTNGTSLNGMTIAAGEGFEVSNGDIISMGSTVMRVENLSVAPVPRVDSMEEGKSETERRSHSSRDLELIYKVSNLLRNSLGLREICLEILAYILDALPRIDRAALLISHEEKHQIKKVIARTRGKTGEEDIRYSRSVVDQVLRDGKAVRMSNTTYEAPGSLSKSMNKMQIRSVMCVPLISKEERRGVIYVDSLKTPYGFRKEDLLLLNSLSGTVAVAIENALLMARKDAARYRKKGKT